MRNQLKKTGREIDDAESPWDPKGDILRLQNRFCCENDEKTIYSGNAWIRNPKFLKTKAFLDPRFLFFKKAKADSAYDLLTRYLI